MGVRKVGLGVRKGKGKRGGEMEREKGEGKEEGSGREGWCGFFFFFFEGVGILVYVKGGWREGVGRVRAKCGVVCVVERTDSGVHVLWR